MRFILLFIFSTALGLNLHSQDYFWVNNGGDWSDVAHWATSSGGSSYHATPPGPANDVYFDANSFTMAGQVVFLDGELQECKNLDATGVVNSPMIQGDYYLDHLDIYGSFALPAEMNRDLKIVEFIAESGDFDISFGEEYMGGLCFIRISGDASYYLQDSLSTGNLYCYGGEFYSNGHAISANSRFRGFQNYSNIINLDGSNLYTNEFNMHDDTELSLAGTKIYIQNNGNSSWSFKGGNKTYPYVKFDGFFSLEDTNHFNQLEVAPGAHVEFDPAFTQTSDEFIFPGTSGEPITLNSKIAGQQANIIQSAGIMNGSWLVLQDMAASGGAVFNANQSVDNGNNSGWNITQNIPQDYFWVGDSGDWSDVSHWATSSGGAIFHVTPPTLLDNVFFDSNSFATSGEEVSIDLANIQLNHVDASGATAGTILSSEGGLFTEMDIYGNIHTGSMIWEVYNLNVLSAESVVTLQSTTGDLDNTQLEVSCSGQLQILDSIGVNWVNIMEGDVSLNNIQMSVFNYFRTQPLWEGTLDADNFTGYIYQWSLLSDLGSYNLQNSTLTIESNFQMNEQAYGIVTLNGDVTVQHGGSIETLNLLPGNSYELVSGITIELENLNAIGTESEPISISSNTAGEEATFSKTNGFVEAEHLILQDNHTTGGATFSAFLSEDLGNTDGWDFVVISVNEQTLEASVFPNPFQDQITIEWTETSGAEMILYDLSGKIVHRAPFLAVRQNIKLPNLKAGSYILELRTSEFALHYQLLKN